MRLTRYVLVVFACILVFMVTSCETREVALEPTPTIKPTATIKPTPQPTPTTEPTPAQNPSAKYLADTALAKQIRNRHALIEKLDLLELYEFVDGVAVAQHNSQKYGILNEKGEWVLEPTHYEIGDFHEGFAKIKPEYKGNWGYINTKGEMVVQPQYRDVYDFNSQVAIVYTNDTGLVIDKTGKVLFDLSDCDGHNCYGDCVSFDDDGTLTVIIIEEKNGEYVDFGMVINKKGRVVINGYKLDLGYIYAANHNGYRTAESNKVHDIPYNEGVIDKKGRWVIEPKYETIEFWDDNMAVVTNSDGSAIITLDGEWVIEPDGTMFFDISDELLVRYTLKEPQKMELFDMEGNILLGGKSHHSISIINDKLVLCSKVDSPDYLFSPTGEAHLKDWGISYSYLLSDNIVALDAYVGEERAWGVLDANNPDKWIVEPRYKKISKFEDSVGFAELPDGTHEVFDIQGNILIID